MSDIKREAPLPGVSGNKGTWSKSYWEQGNKREIKLGTWEKSFVSDT